MGDKQIQYQIIDRTSLRQFLGIHTVDEIPDEKTVWHVKNILSKAGTFDALFDKFRSYLDGKGLSFNEGKIIDASFVEAPKQRNTREENEQIKSGNGKDLWNDKPHKKCHKDTNDLAVLIAVRRTSQPQHFVDNRSHITGKSSLT